MWDVSVRQETCSGIHEQESDIFLASNLAALPPCGDRGLSLVPGLTEAGRGRVRGLRGFWTANRDAEARCLDWAAPRPPEAGLEPGVASEWSRVIT